MWLSKPKIEVLKELHLAPGVPKGSRHATFDSLLAAGLIQPTGEPGRECRLTDKGRSALVDAMAAKPPLLKEPQ